MLAVQTRFNEKVSEPLKKATLVGMLPRVFQEIAFQQSCKSKGLQYVELRDLILSVAKQKKNVHSHADGFRVSGYRGCAQYELGYTNRIRVWVM